MDNPHLSSLIFPFIEPSFLFDKRITNWQNLHDSFIESEYKNIDLDSITSVRKKIWTKPHNDFSVFDSIELISTTFLKLNGGQIELNDKTHLDGNSDSHTIWTIMIKGIDPNILISWKWRNNNPHNCPKSISVNNNQLKNLFSSGLNDYHVHYGAIGTLENLLRARNPNKILLDTILPVNLSEKAWIKNSNLNSTYVNPYLIGIAHGIIATQVYNFHRYYDDPSISLPIHNSSLIQAKKYWKNLEKLLKIEIKDVTKIDPSIVKCKIDTVIEPILENVRRENIKTDNIFLCKSFKVYENFASRINNKNHNGVYVYYLKKMLWLRNYLYTLIVQQPERSGLSFFKQYYDRIQYTSVNDNDLNNKVKSLIPHELYKINILELRFGLSHFIERYRDFITEYSQFNKFRKEGYEENQTKVCYIISLNKNWVKNPFENGVRYSKFVNDLLSEVDEALAILSTYPKLNYLFRGFDVCSFEKALPNWIFILIFNYINEKANELFYNGEENLPNIRFTFHTGEDFYSPLHGLRNLGEVMIWSPISSNNRIGHGLVLGLDIDDWFNSKLGEKRLNSIDVPSGILLDDLIYELFLIRNGLGNQSIKLDGDEKVVIKNIKTVIKFMMDSIENSSDINLFSFFNEDALLESYKCRFDYQKLKYNGTEVSSHQLNLINKSEWFSFQGSKKLNKLTMIEKLYSEYLTSKDLFIAEEIDFPLNVLFCDGYIERCKNVQKYTLNFLTDISIETCPSSNIIISRILDYKKHHIFKLHSINGARKSNVSINTDDPIVFNTNIFNEYQNLFLACRNSDSTLIASNIVDWLSEINSKSVDYSFYKIEGIKNIHEYCLANGIFYEDDGKYFELNLKAGEEVPESYSPS